MMKKILLGLNIIILLLVFFFVVSQSYYRKGYDRGFQAAIKITNYCFLEEGD